MSKETRNTTMKAIAEAEVPVKTVNPIKPVPAKHVPTKQILAKHVPAVHVLTTFEDLMDTYLWENVGNDEYDIVYENDREITIK